MQLSAMTPVVGAERISEVRAALAAAGERLDGRTAWHVSDHSTRGGVAELLNAVIPGFQGEGLATRWSVPQTGSAFRQVTKALYYQLCGVAPPSGGGILAGGRQVYERTCRAAAAELVAKAGRRSVVILHDHQTAGLLPYLREAGCTVLWQSHTGTPLCWEPAAEAWEFLRTYLSAAHGFVTSHSGVLPSGLPDVPHHVVDPSINPLSLKNLSIQPGDLPAQLISRADLVEGPADGGGSTGALADLLVRQPVQVVRGGGPVPAGAPLVTQVSRWDRVKDVPGVMRGFAEHVDPAFGAHLMLVGPDPGRDRESSRVFAECCEAWTRLGRRRHRVHLVRVPVTHPTEHALIINVIQHCSTVVVQKSLAEGFGLTVSEAAWKGRPVVASPVGGLQHQIDHGRTGVLLSDVADLRGLGQELNRLLADPGYAEELGINGRRRVRQRFLTDSSLLGFAHVLARTA